jgi:hypothetical protein
LLSAICETALLGLGGTGGHTLSDFGGTGGGGGGRNNWDDIGCGSDGGGGGEGSF